MNGPAERGAGANAHDDRAATVDIAVVGDGPVGRVLALGLARRGWQVALIDRGAAVPREARAARGGSLDQRCTAISAESTRFLAREGLWHPAAAAAEPIRRVRVSHRGHFGSTRIDAEELGLAALGATFENRAFLASLDDALDRALERGALGRFTGASPARVRREAGQVRLELAPCGRRVVARLAIACDGAESSTRDLLGIGVRRHDYRQSALLATVRLDRDHHGLATERFTHHGPLALLPRPDRALNIVACAAPERVADWCTAGETRWLATLGALSPRRLGRMLESGPRAAVPLQRVEARRQVGERALLLGNAVRLLHPVAGQGFNLALRDIAAWLDTLGEAGRGGGGTLRDPGDRALLDAFAVGRRDDQRRTVRLTDLLARGFRGDSALLGHARAAGLVALDTVGPARRAFARAAMGRGGAGRSR